jgi:hypothetical protein
MSKQVVLGLATLSLLTSTGCASGAGSFTPTSAMPAASSQHTTVASGQHAPDTIAIAPVSGANLPADTIDDGLSSGAISPADDATNVAFADSAALPALDTPGPVMSDDEIRMTSAATTGAIYYGTVYDSMSSNPLPGATITIGQIPNFATCAAKQVCGSPAGKLYKSTTNAKGAFAFSGIPPGPYMLVLSKNAAYANLHAQVNLRAGHFQTSLRLLALSSDETKWLADVNHDRLTISYPKSYTIAIDQYAEIEARAWAAAVADGKTQYGDAAYAPYANAYSHQPGELYGAAAVGALIYGTGQYELADQGWMAEKANCPNGDWQTCPFKDNTGHYMNQSNTDDVWVGVGESPGVEGQSLPWPGYGAYDVMEVMNTTTPGPP